MFDVVRVTDENYSLFRDMVYWREHGFERAPEKADVPEKVKEALGGDMRVYAAQAQGRFVGWIALIFMPKVSRFLGQGYVYVDELWVQEDFRRRGIGKMLMQTADDWAEEIGAVGVRLYVNAENPGAQKLYEKCGYEKSGTAFFMEKER